MYPVEQTLVLDQQLICHVPDAEKTMEQLKKEAQYPKIVEMDWCPKYINRQPALVCTLKCGEQNVSFAFFNPVWQGLLDGYQEIVFHWGDELLLEDTYLELPWDNVSFYRFIREYYQNLKNEDLSDIQKMTLFQIISNFFDIEEERQIEPVQ